MIALTQITNTEIFVVIAVLVISVYKQKTMKTVKQ